MGVVFDESTDISGEKKLIVIVNLITPEGERKHCYLGMPSIEKGDAETVTKHVEALLKDFNVPPLKV